MPHEFLHEPDARRYTLRVGGEVVSVLEYRDQGAGVVFHRTVTIPRHRGHGYAAELVEFAVTGCRAARHGTDLADLLVRRGVVRPES